MENPEKKENEKHSDYKNECVYCREMHHWHGYCGKYHGARVLLKIALVVIIFWLGFTFGRMVGFLGGNYGYHMYGGPGYDMMRGYRIYNNNQLPQMMYGGEVGGQNIQTPIPAPTR